MRLEVYYYYSIYYSSIIGTPSDPLNTSVVANGPNTVVVSWSPPLNSSQCIDHYVVSIGNGTTKNTSNPESVVGLNFTLTNISLNLTTLMIAWKVSLYYTYHHYP